MAVQLRFFNLPVAQLAEAEEKLNTFLKTVRVVDLERCFVSDGRRSFWAVAVEYNISEGAAREKEKAGKGKIDYKAVLSQEEFALFARLRDWRKEISSREGLPVYVIFTNEQLAAIAQQRPGSPGQLKKIEGIGEGRIERYGEEVCKIMTFQKSAAGGEAES